jgi:hypothetical protein
MTLTPQGSRGYPFENTDAHCYHDEQKCDSTQGDFETENAVKDQSERAQSKTVQHQKPEFALSGPPNARCDRASACRQGELTQKYNGA